MKVVHIEAGLGNQMLSYCELLALKYMHPDEDIYIESIIYEIPEADKTISQWNGYELERIFGIKASNVKELFTDEQWAQIVEEVIDSRFWEKNWNYPPYIVNALNRKGLHLVNKRGNFEENKLNNPMVKSKIPISNILKQSSLYTNIRRIYYKFTKRNTIKDDREMLFYRGTEDIYTGQRLSFRYKGNDIELISDMIKEAFRFPEIEDAKNRQLLAQLKACESVAIHARRGDMLSVNGRYYRSGYFRRAVNHIKKNVDNPVFFFFCDPGSIEWCKENGRTFGLNYKKDKVFFVDWNSGEESYRDMQLMSYCKHNIITNSSFGWWGAFLNVNPRKITIAPETFFNTTYSC